HSPNGPINDLASLKIQAGEKTLPWKRDEVDLYSFHVDVPDGTQEIHLSLDYLAPADIGSDHYTTVPVTPNLAIIHAYTILLYPHGSAARDMPVHAQLKLPEGWKAGTALPIESESGATTTFQTVSLETLADSPILSGRYYKEIPLGMIGGAP